jgi:hypothetical protein
MSFGTGLFGEYDLLALDGSIRMSDDTPLELRAGIIDSVGYPAVHIRRACEDTRIGENAFTTS